MVEFALCPWHPTRRNRPYNQMVRPYQVVFCLQTIVVHMGCHPVPDQVERRTLVLTIFSLAPSRVRITFLQAVALCLPRIILSSPRLLQRPTHRSNRYLHNDHNRMDTQILAVMIQLGHGEPRHLQYPGIQGCLNQNQRSPCAHLRRLRPQPKCIHLCLLTVCMLETQHPSLGQLILQRPTRLWPRHMY